MAAGECPEKNYVSNHKLAQSSFDFWNSRSGHRSYLFQTAREHEATARIARKRKKDRDPRASFIRWTGKIPPKGITEIQAEAKFRETLRDFYNRNYSRAILGFNEVLILNGNHEEARYHLLLSKEYLRNEMQSLYDDAERSYGNLQYRRTKAQTMKVLTYIAEQIPSYGRKIAEETAKNPEPRSTSQDENLLTLPCKSYPTDPEICLKSQKLLRAAREKLGDEDALKEVR